MTLTRLIAGAAIAAFSLGVLPAAHAQLRIEVTDSDAEPMPVAIPDFQIVGNVGDVGAEMAEVIRADLLSSGLFRPLDPESFIERDIDIDYQPTFADWRVIKADALVTGRITQQSPEKLLVEFRLWDVFAGEQLTGLRFSTTPDNWRRIAHKVADAVYKNLTGEAGYFDSRLVFIDESGPKTDRRKRLAIMDQDGANKQYLLAGNSLVITPRFDPKSQTITYLSWESTVPQVYLYEIDTGRRELLGKFPGMTFAPRFSPRGDKLVMSMMSRGNSDIYMMDLKSRSTSRLTTDPAIDVSASFSPNGRELVFTSDRGGKPQLYTMKVDGSDVERISFGEGRYSAPVWSPRGDKIAFVRSNKGKFHIGVMNTDGSGERTLTESYMDEAPTWSPNGRVIIFSRTARGSGKSEVWSIDLTGRNLRKVPTGGDASDPAWSPLLD